MKTKGCILLEEMPSRVMADAARRAWEVDCVRGCAMGALQELGRMQGAPADDMYKFALFHGVPADGRNNFP